jgi:hypothetical protein
MTPTTVGTLMANEAVHDFLCRRLNEAAASERANAPHVDRIEPEWAETLAAEVARLTHLRDSFAKAIRVGRGM